MQAPAIPASESERLEDLYAYGILDTETERVFSELASLAAAICGTRFAGISLVDHDRQWFKASHGVELRESSRAQSICGHAILSSEVFEVANIPADERFTDNPLLNGHPRFRFYAGSQLNSQRGNAIGMLCVLDSEPGELTPSQKEALKQLAHVIMSILEARRSDRRGGRWEALLEDAEQPMYVRDADSMRFLGANAAGLRHAHCTMDQLVARGCDEHQPDGDPADFGERVARLRAGEPMITFNVTRESVGAAARSYSVTWQLLATKTRSIILSTIN